MEEEASDSSLNSSIQEEDIRLPEDEAWYAGQLQQGAAEGDSSSSGSLPDPEVGDGDGDRRSSSSSDIPIMVMSDGEMQAHIRSGNIWESKDGEPVARREEIEVPGWREAASSSEPPPAAQGSPRSSSSPLAAGADLAPVEMELADGEPSVPTVEVDAVAGPPSPGGQMEGEASNSSLEGMLGQMEAENRELPDHSDHMDQEERQSEGPPEDLSFPGSAVAGPPSPGGRMEEEASDSSLNSSIQEEDIRLPEEEIEVPGWREGASLPEAPAAAQGLQRGSSSPSSPSSSSSSSSSYSSSSYSSSSSSESDYEMELSDGEPSVLTVEVDAPTGLSPRLLWQQPADHGLRCTLAAQDLIRVAELPPAPRLGDRLAARVGGQPLTWEEQVTWDWEEQVSGLERGQGSGEEEQEAKEESEKEMDISEESEEAVEGGEDLGRKRKSPNFAHRLAKRRVVEDVAVEEETEVVNICRFDSKKKAMVERQTGVDGIVVKVWGDALLTDVVVLGPTDSKHYVTVLLRVFTSGRLLHRQVGAEGRSVAHGAARCGPA
jgi:hypothetical protein